MIEGLMSAIPSLIPVQRLEPNEQAAVTEFVGRLLSRYGSDLLRVVMFGSKARGDSRDDSDLDVLVVISEYGDGYWQHWNELVDLAWDIQLTYGVIISLILKDEIHYARMKRDGLLLARNIERDGLVLWTKQPDALTYTSA